MLELRKKGYKNSVVIKNGSVAMRKAGFVWKEKDNILRQIGPDGKTKHLGKAK